MFVTAPWQLVTSVPIGPHTRSHALREPKNTKTRTSDCLATDGADVFFWMAQRVRLNPKNDLKRLGKRVKTKRKNRHVFGVFGVKQNRCQFPGFDLTRFEALF